MLSAADVSFAYGGALVLSGVSLDIAKGDLVAILGPNGSGKTTLLKLLSGTLSPASGEVRLDATPLHSLTRRAVARRVAVVPQHTELVYDYTVLEMVLMGRHPHLGRFALEGPEDLAIAHDALSATGTAHLESRLFGTLSGGEKQRVAIASALAQATDILLLDEPTSSLDIAYQLEIAALLATLNRERGVTVCLSTHDLNFAAGLCRRLVLLGRGRVLASGPTAEVLTAAHLRELFHVEADVRRHPVSDRLVVVPLGPAATHQ